VTEQSSRIGETTHERPRLHLWLTQDGCRRSRLLVRVTAAARNSLKSMRGTVLQIASIRSFSALMSDECTGSVESAVAQLAPVGLLHERCS
jgi:hypothetical protein